MRPSPTPPGETLLAPAKLTVSLRVTGVRDDGYHRSEEHTSELQSH